MRTDGRELRNRRVVDDKPPHPPVIRRIVSHSDWKTTEGAGVRVVMVCERKVEGDMVSARDWWRVLGRSVVCVQRRAATAILLCNDQSSASECCG